MRKAQTTRIQRPLTYVQRPKVYNVGLPPGPVHDGPSVIVEGYLEQFLELPVEIFTQFCVFLDPQDLRVLSISGHAFRSVLISRNSRPIWAAARLRLYGPMPDPPENMSEPEYARFLFSPECYTCEENAIEMDCLGKVKTCSTCYKIHYLSYQEATTLYPGLPAHCIEGLLPFSFKEGTTFYHRATIESEVQRYLDNAGGGGSESEYKVGPGERHRLNVENATILHVWMENEAYRQAKELQDRYDKRDESIFARMVALGHDKRHVSFSAAESLGLRFLPYDVTDEEWIAMRPQLEMDAVQNKIIQSDSGYPLNNMWY